jgi:hypothetical protein
MTAPGSAQAGNGTVTTELKAAGKPEDSALAIFKVILQNNYVNY